MGFLNALGTVSRRSRWRRPLVFYDLEAGALHDVTDATLSLALFRTRGTTGRRRDAGWTDGCVGVFEPQFPLPFLTSDDGNGYLLPDGANRGRLDVPPAIVSTVPAGVYRASVVATYPDGSFVEVLSELVAFHGPSLAPPPLKPFLTADADVTADAGEPIDGPVMGGLGVELDASLTADSGISIDSPQPVNGQAAGAEPINAPLT